MGGEGSVERAGGEHEPRWKPGLGPAGVKTRTVQAVPGRCLHRGLGVPAVGEDPRHHGLAVGTCGHDRGALDDRAAGGMSSRQSSEETESRRRPRLPRYSRSRYRIVSGEIGEARIGELPWGSDVSPEPESRRSAFVPRREVWGLWFPGPLLMARPGLEPGTPRFQSCG
jgi:hypothetical protein